MSTPQDSSSLAPLVAIVGCDGSGKSTLSADLLEWLKGRRRADTCYLGLRSGTMGNQIKAWPVIGPMLERKLSSKAKQARTKGAKIPGLPTALVIYIFSIVRHRRWKAMMAQRRSGVMIVTDRYPQIEVPGFYDGPGLSAARAGSWAVRTLARRELKLYQKMAAVVPDLVIRLNIDLETAFARKPDHKYDSLKAKVEVTPLLAFNGARIVDLSSTDPYDEVLASARNLVSPLIDC